MYESIEGKYVSLLKHKMTKESPLESTFQAIVSVMAVNIQLSSPNMVRRSLRAPGILQKQNIALYNTPLT